MTPAGVMRGLCRESRDQVGESCTNGSSPALSQASVSSSVKRGLCQATPRAYSWGLWDGGVGMKPRAEELCLPLFPFLLAR